MSVWGKFIGEIVVPTGGYDFAGDDGAGFVATLPAATYSSIYTLCDALETVINAETANEDVTIAVSSIGIVTITGTGAWTITWATTDDDLSTLLGFAETESVDGSDVLTATSRHLYGWYPGRQTFGTLSSSGVGIVSNSIWEPEYETGVRQYAASGNVRLLMPTTPIRRKDITFAIISDDEADGEFLTFYEGFISKTFFWYEDRDDGVVGTEGTQDTDYWEVSWYQDAGIEQANNPNFFTVRMFLSREPT